MLRRLLLTTAIVLACAPSAQAAVTVDDVTATEGNGLTFTVTSDQLALGVQVTTTDGSAKASVDYTATTDALNFPALNGGTQTVTVPSIADTDPETNETFTITATPPNGDPESGTGTIRNDDQPTISVADVTVAESANTAVVTLATQPTGNDVTVVYATADDTANATDFTPSSGTATIPAGQGQTTVNVPLINDTADEDDERFKLTLSQPGGAPVAAKIGDGEAIVTITNDDGRLVSVGDVGVTEGDGEQTVARFPVQLSGPTFRTVTVTFITVDGPQAKAPRDYLARFGSVTFAPGQTVQFIDVAIVSDDTPEPSEFFGVLIGQPQGARVLRGSALASITDDDTGATSGNDKQSPRMKLTKPRLSGGRSVRARVTCPKSEQRCRGKLVLYGKLGKKERRIGSKTFNLPGNAARTLTITIPRSILSSARRSGRLPIRAYMVTSDAADNVDTTTKTATLRVRR